MTTQNASSSSTYIPLDAAESAVLSDIQTLLPLPVYEELDRLIAQAVDKIDKSRQGTDVNLVRSHHAISIDGPRGSGKTSVLVNLKRYLELADESGIRKEGKTRLHDVHVLSPIDPTLLEDGESLFLHIIVAAVLHDHDVKEAQRQKPHEARELNRCLEELAQGMEAVDKQQTLHGLDKIRAMYGNQHLANCVHAFFKAALGLLGKKLLVLPIDDVDTSLNLAFENLEIIRRYLTTPFVLPIVSGDRGLYDEVTWRDFHGRLTKDSKHLPEQAYTIAVDLAHEYQRKILPLPRRLTMPEVDQYWQSGDVALKKIGSSDAVLPLRNLHAWLSCFVSGPVNGLESSRLDIPIPSIRALAQLINTCAELIPALPETVRKAKTTTEVARAWQMPALPLNVLEAFELKHQVLRQEKKRDYAAAYQLFASEEKPTEVSHAMPDDMTGKWLSALEDYFSHEPRGAKVYLALRASRAWWERRRNTPEAILPGIFATPLFQPLLHQDVAFKNFDQGGMENLSDWAEQLKGRLPNGWVEEVGLAKTFLPYPVPEVGRRAKLGWDYLKAILSHDTGCNEEQDQAIKGQAIFLVSLLIQHNFYNNAAQSLMLNIGRIFELLIASLVGPVSLLDLQRIQQEAPFFSTRDLAPTKQINFSGGERDEPLEEQDTEDQDEIDDYLIHLHGEISQWRKEHGLDQVDFAPWLIYKVFNKVYSQVAADPLLVNKPLTDVRSALEIVGRVFYATWAAFGSFEKGPMFGLSVEVATVNLHSLSDFSQSPLYKKNVQPLVWTEEYGKKTRTATYFLKDHPLKGWIDGVLAAWPKKEEKGTQEKVGRFRRGIDLSVQQWLCLMLELQEGTRLTEAAIRRALAGKPYRLSLNLISALKANYPSARRTLARVEKVVKALFPEYLPASV